MILFDGNRKIAEGNRLEFREHLTQSPSNPLTLVCLDGGEAVFDIDIDASGVTLDFRGLYICGGESRLKVSVTMRHNAGGSASTQLFKGIAGGNSFSRFDGRIVVAKNAQKTEAYQTNRNLLLSRTAVVETLPQLEIYADDVKCSHGATAGKLDGDEQFYMRSRGISLEEARRLQMISFLAPVMEGLDAGIVSEINECLAKLK